MERRKKYHILYKTTCTVTGNFYIGVHSTTNLEDGYLGSGKRLSNSIQKHGRENHTREILEFFDDKESAFQREREIVNEILLSNEKCMNLNRGGDGGWSSRMQSKNGKKGNAKMKFLRETDHDWLDRRKRKTIDSLVKSYVTGRRKAVVPDWKGRSHREETKKKISESMSLSQKGEKNSKFGKVWIHNPTEKTNIRIKADDLERHLSIGWIRGRKMKF